MMAMMAMVMLMVAIVCDCKNQRSCLCGKNVFIVATAVIALRNLPKQLIRWMCLKTDWNWWVRSVLYLQFNLSRICFRTSELWLGFNHNMHYLRNDSKILAHNCMSFFADVNLQKHRLKLKYSASKSSSIKFLWHCVSKGAPMTCTLYATPLQLVAFELLRLVFTFIIFGWYQVIIFFVCLSKGKESGKKSRQPLNFCHKKDLRQSRDLNLKDFIHFLKVLSWYGFPCWADTHIQGTFRPWSWSWIDISSLKV